MDLSALKFHNAGDLLAALLKRFPEGSRMVKRFEGVDKYYNYRYCYAAYFLALSNYIYGADLFKQTKSESVIDELLKPTAYMLMSFGAALPYGFPIFFIDGDLFNAAARSTIEFEIDWANTHLPFPAFSIILPKFHYKIGENYLAVLQLARIMPQDWSLPHLKPVHAFGTEQDKPLFISKAFLSDGSVLMQHLTTPYQPHKTLPFFDDEPIDASEAEFFEQMSAIIFSILFAMAARPEYVERGHKIGFYKKTKSEIWTPNIIGRKYAVKRDGEPIGTHASPRMHWRRGHFRQQRFGKERKEIKIIWIEPMLVNPSEKQVAH